MNWRGRAVYGGGGFRDAGEGSPDNSPSWRCNAGGLREMYESAELHLHLPEYQTFIAIEGDLYSQAGQSAHSNFCDSV